MGFYVFVVSVCLGFIDKVFIRVGVLDNIFFGELIFMVEMNEMVSIMNNIFDWSLILLDEIEIGRAHV